MTTLRLTSFATYKDLRNYISCLLAGGSETHCYNEGDNGVGAWGDITAQETVSMCALGEDFCVENFGSWNAGYNKKIKVTYMDASVICRCCDKGPDAVCDLNPAALIELGLSAETELDAIGTVEIL